MFVCCCMLVTMYVCACACTVHAFGNSQTRHNTVRLISVCFVFNEISHLSCSDP